MEGRTVRLSLRTKTVMDSSGLLSSAIVSVLIGERLDRLAARCGLIFNGYLRT